MRLAARVALVGALAAATAQVVGAGTDVISLTVTPRVDPTAAAGSISGGRSGQALTIQFKQCGLLPLEFRDLAEVTTEEGGRFDAQVGAPTNGVFRATSGDAVSNEVAVSARADVRLAPHGGRRYEVDVVSTLSFWHKTVLVQRFDRARRTWKTVRKLPLTKQFGPGLIWSTTERFTLVLPRRTSIRAVLPLDQARPCFLAGYSRILVT
jgi:hypothetical protein